MRIAIIGAGATGLTAAYRLSQKGHRVTVLEKENYLGGLVSGFKKKNWDWHLENFFHHFFTSDQAAKNLLAELGLSRKLFYLRPKTSIFLKGKIYQFDSPLSLLKFPHFSFGQRLRTGLITTYLKTPPRRWMKLEKTTASDWLKKHYGQKPYQILWHPLLKAKFGPKADRISMAWFWARIKKRSARLGYLEGGFQTFIDRLLEKIKKNQGEILLKQEVKNLNNIYYHRNFERIIATVPTPIFMKITHNLPKTYCQKLQKLRMIGAINLILVLKEKFLTDDTYWLNINEPGFPFVAVVEHTNFINPSHYGGNYLLYVGGYYPQNHRYFKMAKEQILAEFLPYLQKVNPKFNVSRITYHLSHNLFAQPVIPVNYSQILPQMKTPLPNLFLANMQMVYPWDRGVNYAVELGEKVAERVAP